MRRLVLSVAGDHFFLTKAVKKCALLPGLACILSPISTICALPGANGRVHWPVMGLLLLVYLPYCLLLLSPAIDDPVLSISILVAHFLSVLAVATGLRLSQPIKAIYILGIALIVLPEFLQYRNLNWLT
jgi:hypothetical protein